jgi:hypothetical protein
MRESTFKAVKPNIEMSNKAYLYRAHKAANPDRYPIRDAIKKMLPQLEDPEKKYPPTQVHLQVYDGACHVLPMFSFTEPAKHCYRAIASWCKFATSRHPVSKQSADLKAKHEDGLHPQLSMSSLDIASRQQSFSTEANSEAPSIVATRTSRGPPVLAPIVIPEHKEGVERMSAVSGVPGSATARFLPSEMYKTASPAPSLLHREQSEPQTPDLTSWEITDGEVSQPGTPMGDKPNAFEDDDKVDLRGEIKVPKNIPKGFAGNYEIYNLSNVSLGTSLKRVCHADSGCSK